MKKLIVILFGAILCTLPMNLFAKTFCFATGTGDYFYFSGGNCRTRDRSDSQVMAAVRGDAIFSKGSFVPWPAVLSSDLLYQMLHDSRNTAAQWLKVHLNKGSKVGYCGNPSSLPHTPGNVDLVQVPNGASSVSFVKKSAGSHCDDAGLDQPSRYGACSNLLPGILQPPPRWLPRVWAGSLFQDEAIDSEATARLS